MQIYFSGLTECKLFKLILSFCYRCCSVLELQSKTWFILLWMNREWELFLQTSNQRFVQLCIVWKENDRASFSTFEWWYTQRCKKWFAVVIIFCWFVKFQTGFGLQKICGSKTDPTDIKNAIQPGKDTKKTLQRSQTLIWLVWLHSEIYGKRLRRGFISGCQEIALISVVYPVMIFDCETIQGFVLS